MQSSAYRSSPLPARPAWEHRVIHINTDGTPFRDDRDTFASVCTHMGEAGWELVSTLAPSRSAVFLFFKRMAHHDATPNESEGSGA